MHFLAGAVKIFSHQEVIDKDVQEKYDMELMKDWKVTSEEIGKLQQLQPERIKLLQIEAEKTDLVTTRITTNNRYLTVCVVPSAVMQRDLSSSHTLPT